MNELRSAAQDKAKENENDRGMDGPDQSRGMER